MIIQKTRQQWQVIEEVRPQLGKAEYRLWNPCAWECMLQGVIIVKKENNYLNYSIW